MTTCRPPSRTAWRKGTTAVAPSASMRDSCPVDGTSPGDPAMELSAYDFSTLRGGTFTLSRGHADGKAPILLVAPVGEYPARESLARLEHEYSLRRELDPDWAARPVQLVRRDQRQVLVLEDHGGEPLESL